MDAQKAADELTVIRQLMERPVRSSTASGVSGIIAGLAALAGAAAEKYLSPRLADHLAERGELMSSWDWVFIIGAGIWAAVFCVAFVGVVVLTRIRERRQGMPFWSPVKRRVLRTILPPFVAGCGLTVAIYYQWIGPYSTDQPYLIPAIWMLFYGLALWQVGEFSIPEVRLLGAAFIAAGIVSAAVLQWWYPYECLGATFGGFHIAYGVVVWTRHGG